MECSYGTNGQVFVSGGGTSYPGSIPDGTSNTLFFIDVFSVSALNQGWMNDWIGNNQLWTNSDPANGTVNFAVGVSYPQFGMLSSNPNYVMSEPASGHTASVNASLGDGSVRVITQGISPATFFKAITPQGGDVLGSDW